MSQTPSQTIGPYFAYGLCPEQYRYAFTSVFATHMAQPCAPGEHLTIQGMVYDGAGKPVDDAMIEAIQADHAGCYPGREPRAACGFTGFARVGTGADPSCRYRIDTVKPGVVRQGEAPHVDLIIHMRGLLQHVYTRLYFSDETQANARDPVLAGLDPARRDTLIARRMTASGRALYAFDIHMQGPHETVFFDL